MLVPSTCNNAIEIFMKYYYYHCCEDLYVSNENFYHLVAPILFKRTNHFISGKNRNSLLFFLLYWASFKKKTTSAILQLLIYRCMIWNTTILYWVFDCRVWHKRSTIQTVAERLHSPRLEMAPAGLWCFTFLAIH